MQICHYSVSAEYSVQIFCRILCRNRVSVGLYRASTVSHEVVHASSRTLYALTPRCHTWALNRSVLHFHLSHAVHFHTVIFVHTSLMNVNSNHPWGDALQCLFIRRAAFGDPRGEERMQGHHFALPSGPTTAKLFERRCRIR